MELTLVGLSNGLRRAPVGFAAADGSIAANSYSGNSTTTTDPIGNWKTSPRTPLEELRRRYGRQLTSGAQFDEEVHRVLGHVLAGLIGDGLIFENGDSIGVGAGRGVYYTVDALCARCAATQPLFCEQIRIVSLTGSVEATSYIADIPYHMDADLHAMNLMRCFTGATARFVSSPIIPRSRTQSVQHTPLADDVWNETRPAHALVGVGVLTEGHRFYREINDPRVGSTLEPIREDLRELVEFCTKLHLPAASDDCAVGDFCHRLFFMPSVGPTISKSLMDSVGALIDRINSRMLTVSEDQLKSIKNLIVVAGTRRKALAIKELLNSGRYNIRYLCTDSTSAEKILET